MIKTLDARGKGVYTYDYKHDVLLFKVKDREYSMSLDFDGFIIDIDSQGMIMGMRIFDAAKVFRRPKLYLRQISTFEFKANVDNNVISIQLQFICDVRNKGKLMQGQSFVREALDSKLKDSEVLCTVA